MLRVEPGEQGREVEDNKIRNFDVGSGKSCDFIFPFPEHLVSCDMQP